MEMPINNALKRIVERNNVRFHMPGHKGRSGYLPSEVLRFDITEINGSDNLMMPTGVIEQSQKMCAETYGAKDFYYLVNGSTTGVMAAIMAACGEGDKILMARDMHVSAINGVIMSGAKPAFIYPSSEDDRFSCVITYNDVKQAISAKPDAKGLYITYPNYYGLCCDLEKIIALAHMAHMTVIVDSAHGAHFGFSDLTPISCGEACADIWVMSLHKNLNCPNQTACICVGDKCSIDSSIVKKRINMLQTTSPSYLFLASMEESIVRMSREGERKIEEAAALAEKFIYNLNNLGGYKCVNLDVPTSAGAYDNDIFKLVIDVTDRGVTGFSASKSLSNLGVECETADLRNIVFMISCDTIWEDYARALKALEQINGTNFDNSASGNVLKLIEKQSEENLEIRKYSLCETRRTPFYKSIGEICCDIIGTYPPGIPLMLPGQRIELSALEMITKLQKAGYCVFGSDGNFINVAAK